MSFVRLYGFPDLNPFERMLRTCYFVLTTLATIGYGDMYPVNKPERIFVIFIMLGGVAFFS